MSFSIQQKILAEILTIAVKVPENRNTIEIGECARICFNDDGLSVSTTNFDNWITLSTIGFKVKKDSDIAVVPIKALHALISSIDKDQNISLSFAGKRLTVKSGASKYTFGSLSPDEWPSIKEMEKSEKISIKSKELRKALAFTLPSVSREETRYYLNGVCLTQHGDKALRFMASDGHRASSAIVGFDKKIKAPTIIMPYQIIGLYLELLGRIDDETDLTFEASQQRTRLEFKGDYSVSLSSRLIDGQFPDLDQVIPYARESTTYIVPRAETISALRRLYLVMSGELRSCISFSFSGDKLRLQTTNDKGGEAEEIIRMEGKNPDAIIGMAAHNILTILSAFEGSEKIALTLDAKDFVGVVIVTDPKTELKPDAEALAVCMPMRI